jgi:hypothetical protein
MEMFYNSAAIVSLPVCAGVFCVSVIRRCVLRKLIGLFLAVALLVGSVGCACCGKCGGKCGEDKPAPEETK